MITQPWAMPAANIEKPMTVLQISYDETTRKHSNPLREPDAPHQGIRDFKIIVAPTSGFAFSQENSMPLNSYIYAAKQTVSQTRR
jgi:hypothetical protein